MTNCIDIELFGHSFRLFAERCMYWPAQRMLFVADTHFGKEATFIRSGIPVPAGSTEGTLKTIGSVLRKTDALSLCVLGDLFHAKSSLSPRVRTSIESFFGEFPDVRFILVPGNHDAHVGRLPTNWPIETIDAGVQMERIAVGHHPAAVPEGADLYLCGHLHPAIHVSFRNESLGRLPCFWHSDRCMVLPAIGEFTGTHLVRPGVSDAACVTAGDEVFQYVPAKAVESRLGFNR